MTGNGDTDVEPDETVVITLSAPSNAQFAGGAVTIPGTGTIENDDDPVITIDAPSVAEGDSGTATLTFTVSLSAASSEAVTVKYADAGTGTATSGTDYAAITAGTLTFTPGDTEESINVTVNGDTAGERDRDRPSSPYPSRPMRSSRAARTPSRAPAPSRTTTPCSPSTTRGWWRPIRAPPTP